MVSKLLHSCLAVFFILLAVADPSSGCSSSDEEEKYRVIRKTDSDGKQLVVAVGDDARLSCQTSVPWKTCMWKPPRNGVRQVRRRELYVRLSKQTSNKVVALPAPV